MPFANIDQHSQRYPRNLAELPAREMIKVLYEFLDPRYTDEWSTRVAELRSIFSTTNDIEEYKTKFSSALKKSSIKSFFLCKIITAYFVRLMADLPLSLNDASPKPAALQRLTTVSPVDERADDSYLDQNDFCYLNMMIICRDDTLDVRGKRKKIADIILNEILVTHPVDSTVAKNFQDFVDYFKQDNWLTNKKLISDLLDACRILVSKDISSENFYNIRERQLAICKVNSANVAVVVLDDEGSATEEIREASPPKKAKLKEKESPRQPAAAAEPQPMSVDSEVIVQELQAKVAALDQQRQQDAAMIKALEAAALKKEGRHELLQEQHVAAIKELKQQIAELETARANLEAERDQLQTQIATQAAAHETQLCSHQEKEQRLSQELQMLQAQLAASKQPTVPHVAAATAAAAVIRKYPVTITVNGKISVQGQEVIAFASSGDTLATIKITPPTGDRISTNLTGQNALQLLKGTGTATLLPEINQALMRRDSRAATAAQTGLGIPSHASNHPPALLPGALQPGLPPSGQHSSPALLLPSGYQGPVVNRMPLSSAARQNPVGQRPPAATAPSPLSGGATAFFDRQPLMFAKLLSAIGPSTTTMPEQGQATDTDTDDIDTGVATAARPGAR